MANPKNPICRLLFLVLFTSAMVVQDAADTKKVSSLLHNQQGYDYISQQREGELKDGSKRLLIGSVAPTCTYNECRECKYKCRAEQVPVDGNDPINKAYRYRCVCHR